MELCWVTLKLMLALEQLLGTSLGAASGTLTAHKHSTGSVDREFGALGGVLEAPLVASGCLRDLQSLKHRFQELVWTGLSSI